MKTVRNRLLFRLPFRLPLDGTKRQALGEPEQLELFMCSNQADPLKRLTVGIVEWMVEFRDHRLKPSVYGGGRAQ